MKLITCRLDGKEYKIDYEKTVITSGTLFHGTLYLEHIFEFFFVVFRNGDPVLFSPLDAPDSKKETIIQAILENEKMEPIPAGHQAG